MGIPGFVHEWNKEEVLPLFVSLRCIVFLFVTWGEATFLFWQFESDSNVNSQSLLNNLITKEHLKKPYPKYKQRRWLQ